VNFWKTLLICCSLVFLLVGCDSDSKNKNDSPAVAGEGGSKPSGGGAECTRCKSGGDCGQGMGCAEFQGGAGKLCARPETAECPIEGDSPGGGSGRECDSCVSQGDCGGGMECTPFEDGSGSVCALPETVQCPGGEESPGESTEESPSESTEEESPSESTSEGSDLPPDRDPPLTFPGPSGILGG